MLTNHITDSTPALTTVLMTWQRIVQTITATGRLLTQWYLN